jgi:hypothetical protein
VRFAKGLAGVVLGFLVFAAITSWLAGLGEQWGPAAQSTYLFANLACIVAAAALAGYIAAFFGEGHEFPWAASVGLLMVILAFSQMRTEGANRPGWYHMMLAGCGPISALIGAAIRVLTKRRGNPGAPPNRAEAHSDHV